MLPFGGDQQKLDLIMKFGELSMTVMAVASQLDVPETIAMMRAERPDDVFGKITLRCDLVEPLDRGLDPLPPGLVLIDCISTALESPCMGEAEHPYHRGEQQSLADQCHEDDGKRQKKNQIAAGKRLAIRGCKRDRERCRERDHAANSGEGEYEWPLPRWRRIPALNCGKSQRGR